MLASFSLIDGILATLGHSATIALNASRFTIFGVQDKSSEELKEMNVDGNLTVIFEFLKAERAAIEDYKPASACAECIHHLARKVQSILQTVSAKIEVHEQALLRHWHPALCTDELDNLRNQMAHLKEEFRLLLQIMQQQNSQGTDMCDAQVPSTASTDAMHSAMSAM